MLRNVSATCLSHYKASPLRQKMTARHASKVCRFCRPRPTTTIGLRHLNQSAKGSLQAVAVRDEEEGSLQDGYTEKLVEGSDNVVAQRMKNWTLQDQMDEFQKERWALEALVQSRDARLEVMKKLSNPCSPNPVHTRFHDSDSVVCKSSDTLRLLEAQGAPIPHATFRELLRTSHCTKTLRKVFHAQMLRVEHPRDLLRIVAVAMQERRTAEHLALLHDSMIRALYRCRGKVSDQTVLATINTIVARFRSAGLTHSDQIFRIAIKFAARARSMEDMKKYLRILHERKHTVTCHLFRSIIAKFSIGQRGVGEIRNGRWRRAELMQVLTGFDDCKHLPPEQQYHLGTFLVRSNWKYNHGWVATLARCKACDAVWDEWVLWTQDDGRLNPKRLATKKLFMTTKMRGDYWFVEQMTLAGDVRRAWRILAQTTIPFLTLKPHIKSRLLDGAEHATVWGPQYSEAMLAKYHADLLQVERAFGVKWQAGEEDGSGQHVLFRDQEEALEELGADDWTCEEEDYGFPHGEDDENGMRLSQQERLLHDAEPTEAAVTTTH